ncbi:hypothetical protein BCCH1_68910 [Burkholderia contaminans]|uniref:Uncharacterized protein n=1 Tax=Burkholderia contaminans TaxID=488447 RepID=A0A250LIN9_9BURK|nr:hypothetical protein BCCH1_68910 [Burkholderia contaminans]GLZ70517.1 hypothetical protein Bcon01_35620 [Burkholderia contaminans]
MHGAILDYSLILDNFISYESNLENHSIRLLSRGCARRAAASEIGAKSAEHAVTAASSPVVSRAASAATTSGAARLRAAVGPPKRCVRIRTFASAPHRKSACRQPEQAVMETSQY